MEDAQSRPGSGILVAAGVFLGLAIGLEVMVRLYRAGAEDRLGPPGVLRPGGAERRPERAARDERLKPLPSPAPAPVPRSPAAQAKAAQPSWEESAAAVLAPLSKEERSTILELMRRGRGFLDACRQSGKSKRCVEAGDECLRREDCGRHMAALLGAGSPRR